MSILLGERSTSNVLNGAQGEIPSLILNNLVFLVNSTSLPTINKELPGRHRMAPGAHLLLDPLIHPKSQPCKAMG